MEECDGELTILVADDDPDDLRLLEDILEEAGYCVRVANNGEMALKSAQELPPDLMILDVRMPKMNGIETCQGMKEDPVLKDIPVIFISGLAETEEKVKAFEIGAVAFLTKPFEPREVVACSEAHIKFHSYSRKLEQQVERKTRELEEALKESESKLRTQTDQLIQVEKMAGLGVMAAGIAHELNNPLMGILNFSQYCIKHTPEDSRAYPVLKDIECEAQRSADIIHNMLIFSHKDIEVKDVCEPIDLVDMIGQIERLLGYRLTKDGVEVILDISENAPELAVDTGKLQQVLVNLITNALDAFGGREEKKITVSLGSYDGKARITVEDTGIGIPPDKVNKIFDPFFTTKEVGKGTGMGLSITHTIINSFAGEIVCESEQDKGTKFHLILPLGGECVEQTSIGDR